MNKRVLVVGGSEEFTGAVYLAGIAALRSGAESVVVMAPERVAWALNALSPDLVTRKLRGKYLAPAHKKIIEKRLKTADVLVLGNGAGVRAPTARLMRSLVHWSGLKVIDADALKVLRGNAVRNAILTPNDGEWKLLEKYNNIGTLLANGNVIIQKGNPTQILSSTVRFRQKHTNRGLDKAGTGDVLAGLCAGYLARGLSLFEAAKNATRIGNAIADILTRKKSAKGGSAFGGKKGYFFLASDIVEELQRTVARKRRPMI